MVIQTETPVIGRIIPRLSTHTQVVFYENVLPNYTKCVIIHVVFIQLPHQNCVIFVLIIVERNKSLKRLILARLAHIYIDLSTRITLC